MGLTRKILLFTSSIVVALVAITLAFTTVQANRLARTTVAEGLGETRAFWSAFEADRYAKLRLGLRVLANDPYFKAGIEAAIETGDEPTVLDMLRERGADLKADFFIATNAEGRVVARSDRPGAAGEDLSTEPVVGGALEGEGAATVWRQGEGLFHAVSVPMTTGPELKGTLVSGHRLDEALAHQIRRLTHADVAFLTREAGGAARVAASSLASREADLTAVLSQLPQDASDDTAPFEIALAGERWAGIVLPLRSAAGDSVGSVLAIRSHAKEMAPYLQFRTSLIVVSVTVMALALGLAFFAATRVTNPLRRLVALVERARDGSYRGAVVVDTADEIGVLARAFNNLLTDLREKDQLIGFLREGLTLSEQSLRESQALTAAQASLPPTGATAALAPGSAFADRYEIKSLLGRGGMGVVYLAHDRQLDEPVALKLLRSEVLQQDPTLLQRFKQEIRLARRITHRNVLRTHDFGEAAGVPYISMEYVEGVTLKDLVRSRGALPLGVGLRIAKQACLGLEAAHAQGVVHRDIKPQNMLIIPETGDLKITDFGIARVSERDEQVTSTGMVLGTPAYMPPEQAQGKPADFRSDIYSLGVVLFEIFSGRVPFSGDTHVAVLMQQVQSPPPAPRSLNPRLPEALEAVILRCLEKNPARRYAGAGEVLAALTDLSSRLESQAA